MSQIFISSRQEDAIGFKPFFLCVHCKKKIDRVQEANAVWERTENGVGVLFAEHKICARSLENVERFDLDEMLSALLNNIGTLSLYELMYENNGNILGFFAQEDENL